jgi:hypothetical protein
MVKKFTHCRLGAIFAGLLLLIGLLPHQSWAQEGYDKLYLPAAIQKHKIRILTVEFYASAADVDSFQPAARVPDYRERFYYDDQGRPTLYEAINLNIQVQGSPGPQLISRYEYSENGRTCHRHDTTVFGSSGEWHFRFDSVGRAVGDDMYLPDKDAVAAQRSYFYDAHGRLEKRKTVHQGYDKSVCEWTFYVHDNQSFNATSLSPMEMARCQCNLEYLDDKGRPVRRIAYDSTGTISQSILLSYDRTGKPVKVELLDGQGKQIKAFAEIIYERNGVVQVNVDSPGTIADPDLARLAAMGRAFVVDHWADWRLLREIRVTQGKQEFARYLFSYDLRG